METAMTMQMKDRKQTRTEVWGRSEWRENSIISRALYKAESLLTNCSSDAALEKGLGQLKRWAILAPKIFKSNNSIRK